MTTSKFYVPTASDIDNVVVGSKAPNYTGQMKVVSSVTCKGLNIKGKKFVCYYVKSDTGTGSISHSLTEGQIDRSIELTAKYDSYELDEIEREIEREGYSEILENRNWQKEQTRANF